MSESEQFQLINITEEIVKNAARDMIKQEGLCSCEKCLLDVCALALNQFGGNNYVTSRKGEIFAKVMYSSAAATIETTVAVCKAIEIVKRNPRHEG